MYQRVTEKMEAVLSAARAVVLILPDIEAAPTTVVQLRSELSSINSQIINLHQILFSERAAWDAERRRAADADDFENTQREIDRRDHATQIAELRAKLVATQNQIFAEQRKLEEIVKKLRKAERQWANPVAQPVGSG
jgi:flagellin-like hook-associated protein FlgL